MKTLNYHFTESIAKHKDKVLFIQPASGEKLTFSGFGAALRKVHRLLKQQHVRPGEVVTLISANSIDLAVMIYGVITFGAIAKPLNPQVTSAELEKLLLHSGSRVIFADHRIAVPESHGKYFDMDAYRWVVDEGGFEIEEGHENSPALLIYTSGTTSQPKGVLLSHRNIVHNVLTAVRFFDLNDQHTKICILPLFHTFGFISDLSAMAFCGGTTVILDTFDVTKLPLIEEAIHTYPVNSFSAVPLMFELFLRFGCNLAGKHMRFCVSGAAPLRESTAAEFLDTYKFPIIPAYGLTETTCFATISPPGRIKPRSAGIPAAVTARVTRNDGEEAATWEIGELLLSGESVMQQAYFKSEIECFHGDDKKWFKTGDLGYRDEEGYIYITGRKKNMVIRGGEKIYLEDVNACLAEMKSLADSASIRFEEDGEDKIVTFVVPHESVTVTEFEIRTFIEKQLGRLRVPDLIMFTARIPRTSTNKIKIRELLELVHQTEKSASVLKGPMPTKTILVTEPADPIQRRLAIRLLLRPELRVVSFCAGANPQEYPLREITAGHEELQFRNCDHTSVDEVWHTKNPAHSFEESRTAMQRVLAFVRQERVSVIHYVSTLQRTEETLGGENGSHAGKTAQSRDEECHFWNERALEESGCGFRIYRIPLFMEEISGATNAWTRFVLLLRRFGEEIEGRIPGYFTANPLRIYLSEEGTVSLARLDDIVHALEETSTRNDLTSRQFHISVREPLPLSDYFPPLARLTGLRLQMVPEEKQSNLVDRLFAARMRESLPYLTGKSTMSMTPGNGGEFFQIPQATAQDLLRVTGANGSSSEAATLDWKAEFEKKQLVLPEGVPLNYYIGGRGEKALVLINAYGQSFGYWERFIHAMSDQTRVVLWIPRGNEFETLGQKLASPHGTHADDLERVLTNENIASCTLVAWCSGPKLALEYYSRYSYRVSSMVFIAPSFKGLARHKAMETDYEKNLEPLLETVEKYPDTADVVLEYLKGILLAQSKQTRSIEQLASISDKELQDALTAVNVNLQELVLEPFCAANVVAYAKQMHDFWRHDFLPGLDEVAVPVLFVGGDCDRIASQAIAKAVAGVIPRAKYLEIKGGTHYIHYEQWDMLAQVVEDVVKSGGEVSPHATVAGLTEPAEESMTMRQG